MSQRFALLGILILVAAACSDRDSTLTYSDTIHGPQLDGSGSFLQPCSQDTECFGGHCLYFGGTKRCTRTCSSTVPCPSLLGWSCNSQSLCECTPAEKQSNVCNVDGDCDGQPDKLPQTETCNGADDDCNDKIDDVAPNTAGATLYYPDGDSDGYGSSDQSTAKWLCQAKAGWITRGGDCNDARKEDHPDAAEICGDTYDNDCDGSTEDDDTCGRTPVVVADVRGSSNAGELKACGPTAGVSSNFDIDKIFGRQDEDEVRFTLRFVGSLATGTCTTYSLHFGDPSQSGYKLVYLYRPSAGTAVCGTLPALEVYVDGEAASTSTVEAGDNKVAASGEVFFIINKDSLLRQLPSPSYKLRACVNESANAEKDRSECLTESCETPVHR